MNNSIIEYIPFSEFMSLVRSRLKAYDSQGFIDESSLIPIVMVCNATLGIPVYDVKEKILGVENGFSKLPEDFYKLYYACALSMTNTTVTDYVNPFDNRQDRILSYDACVEKGVIACQEHTQIIYKKNKQHITQSYYNWQPVNFNSRSFLHPKYKHANNCRNNAEITDNGEIKFSFRTGEVYMMYTAKLLSEDGQILIPFHPLITPWYEWKCVEEILNSMFFDSDIDLNKLQADKQIAQDKMNTTWLQCVSVCNKKDYQQWKNDQLSKENTWFNKWWRPVY